MNERAATEEMGETTMKTAKGDALFARINGEIVAAPAGAIAHKYADPTEDARWVYDLSDRREIESADRNLIVELSAMVRCAGCGEELMGSEAEWVDGSPYCAGCAE